MAKWRNLLVAASLLAAGACGKATDPASTDAGEEQTWEGPAEIVFYDTSGGNETRFNQIFGDMIRARFPQYAIRFFQNKDGTRLPELIASGQRVDIIYNTIEYVPQQLLATGSSYDMTALVQKHGIDLGAFDKTLIDGIRRMNDGKLMEFPVLNMVQLLFYNKGLFDKFGVPYPKDGMTWDDVMELEKKLSRTEDGVNYIGYASSPSHILRTNQMSVPYVDPVTRKPTFDNDKWKTLFELHYSRLVSDPLKAYVAQAKRIPLNGQFGQGMMAMYPYNSQLPFDSAEEMKKIDWDVVSLPTFKELPKVGSQSSPYTFAVTGMADNKDACVEVLKYLTSVEAQSQYSKKGFMTVLNDRSVQALIGTQSAFPDKNWKAAYYNNPAELSYKSQYDADVEKYIITDGSPPLIMNLIGDKVDINTTLRQLQEQATKELESKARQ